MTNPFRPFVLGTCALALVGATTAFAQSSTETLIKQTTQCLTGLSAKKTRNRIGGVSCTRETSAQNDRDVWEYADFLGKDVSSFPKPEKPTNVKNVTYTVDLDADSSLTLDQFGAPYNFTMIHFSYGKTGKKGQDIHFMGALAGGKITAPVCADLFGTGTKSKPDTVWTDMAVRGIHGHDAPLSKLPDTEQKRIKTYAEIAEAFHVVAPEHPPIGDSGKNLSASAKLTFPQPHQ